MFIYFSLFLSIIISYSTNIIPNPLHFSYGYDLSINLGNEYNNSIMKNVYLSSWNLLDQIILIFIKLGLNPHVISKLIYLITTFFISFSLLHIMYALTNSEILSIITISLQYLTFFNVGFGDYPGWIVSPHLHFLFSQSMILLGIFFFIKKKNKPLIGLLLLIIGFHVVMGSWFLFNFIILFYFLNKELKSKILSSFKNNYYLYFSISILIISLFFFLFLKNNFFSSFNYEFSDVNTREVYKLYINNWDYHRSFDVLYKNSLIRILIILLMLSYLFFRKIDKSYLILFITIIIVNSLIFFAVDRILSNYDVIIHKTFMPSRFMNQASFFSLIIISSFIFQFMKDLSNYIFNANFKKILKFTHIVLICFISYVFSILDPTALAVKKHINKIDNLDINFWKQVKEKKIEGSILANYKSSLYSTIYANKIPIISNFGYDFLPYHQEYLGFFREFVYDFLSEDFSNPKNIIKNRGYIPDELLKSNVEIFSKQKWSFLSEKYLLSALILPVNWNINLEPSIVGINFKYYELDGKNN